MRACPFEKLGVCEDYLKLLGQFHPELAAGIRRRHCRGSYTTCSRYMILSLNTSEHVGVQFEAARNHLT